MDDQLVLGRNQRDEILRAVTAIERQVKQVLSKSDWQALYVIGTNLSIIQTNVMNMPRVSSN
jgi:hypothetical protein